MQKREAILASMIAKAIKGDVRAASLIVNLMGTHEPASEEDKLVVQIVRFSDDPAGAASTPADPISARSDREHQPRRRRKAGEGNQS